MAAKITAKGLPDFYVKFNADTGERMSHLALRWTIMTMVRTQETRFAEFGEFEDMDGDIPMWRLTPERMKMRTAFACLPLHDLARARRPWLNCRRLDKIASTRPLSA